MAIALAFALPALAQQPTRPREGDDIARLREQIRDLETKLNESGKKDEKKKDEKKKDEKKDEPKRPMGGGFTGGGFGGPGASGPMGGYGGAGGFPMGRGGAGDRPAQSGMNGPDLARMPGFDNLSKDEQKMLMALGSKRPPKRSRVCCAGRAVRERAVVPAPVGPPPVPPVVAEHLEIAEA